MLENQESKSAAIRANIIALRDKDPEISASEMSRILGRSRERIRQLLIVLDLPTNTRLGKEARLCKQCHSEIVIGKKSKKMFCSRECFSNSLRTLIPCSRCGELLIKRIAHLEYYINKGYRHFFCNRECFGSWAGNQWGWQTERGHSTPKGVRRAKCLPKERSTTSKLLEASLRGIRRLRG